MTSQEDGRLRNTRSQRKEPARNKLAKPIVALCPMTDPRMELKIQPVKCWIELIAPPLTLRSLKRLLLASFLSDLSCAGRR